MAWLKTVVFLLVIGIVSGCGASSASTSVPRGQESTRPPRPQLEWVEAGRLELPLGVASITWSGKTLLFGDKGYRIMQWDGISATPTTLNEPSASARGSGIVGLLVVQDGKMVSQTAEQGTVWLRDPQGEPIQRWDPPTGSGLFGAQVVAQYPSFVASVAGRSSFQIINLDAGTKETIELDKSAQAWSVAWAKQGSPLAIGTSVNTIFLIAWPTKDVLATIQIPASEGKVTRGVRGLAFSSSGTSVAAGVPNGLYIVDVASQQGHLIELDSAIQDVAWSPTADHGAVVDNDGQVWVWSDSTSTPDVPIARLPVGIDAYRIAWSDDGQRLAVGGEEAIELWELTTP